MNVIKTRSIACIGEAMIELSFPGASKIDAKVGFAGDTLNTAIYLRREIPETHKVSFVSALGNDPYSERIIKFIASENVLTTSIQCISDRLPGLYAIDTDANGERSFSYWRENSAARMMFQTNGLADFSVLEQFDVLYYSAITLAILPGHIRDAFFDWMQVFRSKPNHLVVFDSNYRPRLWESADEARATVDKAWRHADIALPSIEDESILFGDKDETALLARFNAYGIKHVVLKRGHSGPIALNESTSSASYTPALAPIDSTAAGDSFNGAFLASYLSGNTLEDAMLAGHSCARNVVSFAGAIVPEQEYIHVTNHR